MTSDKLKAEKQFEEALNESFELGDILLYSGLGTLGGAVICGATIYHYFVGNIGLPTDWLGWTLTVGCFLIFILCALSFRMTWRMSGEHARDVEAAMARLADAQKAERKQK